MFVTSRVMADILSTIMLTAPSGTRVPCKRAYSRYTVELKLTRGANIWRVHEVRLFWMISRCAVNVTSRKPKLIGFLVLRRADGHEFCRQEESIYFAISRNPVQVTLI